MDKVSALRKYFGLDGFRPGQERLIDEYYLNFDYRYTSGSSTTSSAGGTASA